MVVQIYFCFTERQAKIENRHIFIPVMVVWQLYSKVEWFLKKKKRTLAMLCQIKSVPQIPKFNFLMLPFTLLLQKNQHNFFNTFLKPALGGIVFFDYIEDANKEQLKKSYLFFDQVHFALFEGCKKSFYFLTFLFSYCSLK